MERYSWPYGRRGAIASPLLPVRVRRGRFRSHVLRGLIDSGSDVTLIPRGIASSVGIPLRGIRTERISSLGGTVECHRARVDLEVLHPSRTFVLGHVEVVASLSDRHPVILGRNPLFRAFDVLFQERLERVTMVQSGQWALGHGHHLDGGRDPLTPHLARWTPRSPPAPSPPRRA